MKLEDMLAKLRGKVDSKWYQFGLAIGLPKEMLSQLVGYSNEDCLVEVLDFWLKHHPDQPTWKELADALEDLQDYELATVILNVYETGQIIIIVAMFPLFIDNLAYMPFRFQEL